nr:unnamed protein product [Callosobruchus analis]
MIILLYSNNSVFPIIQLLTPLWFNVFWPSFTSSRFDGNFVKLPYNLRISFISRQNFTKLPNFLVICAGDRTHIKIQSPGN